MKTVPRPSLAITLVCALAAPLAAPLAAQNAAQDVAAPGQTASEIDLAKQLANPVASLISVPFQSNFDFGIGPSDATRYTLNIQPVIPFELSEHWNLITRTILPLIDAESPAPGSEDKFGLGDTVQTFFFSPREPVNDWILGVGPAFLWPTATDDMLGTGQWGAGPSVVALQQTGPWTYGVLANHLWTYAGESDREDVNSTFLNPFVSYIMPTKTTFTASPELTYDWNSERWNAPVNLIVSQLLKIGDQPVSIALGGRYYFDGPDGGPEWGIRFNIVFLFPK